MSRDTRNVLIVIAIVVAIAIGLAMIMPITQGPRGFGQ